MIAKVEKAVKALEDETKELRSLLPFAQRAFVIEFAGTPKSGKSTAVEAIRHFFSRQAYRVHVLTERAAACPIPMKGHLFFNTWCATSMLAELLENVETDTDIVIVDRGLFDALVWLQTQKNRGELTQQEAKTIEAFLLLERWRSLIDLSVVMRVSAPTAIKREVGNRITKKLGSIMNPDVLQSITKAVKTAEKNYAEDFHLLAIDTTKSKNVRESNTHLAEQIVKRFREFLNPPILVVPRNYLEKFTSDKVGSFDEGEINRLLICISKHGKFVLRSVAENDDKLVQIVAAGILTSQNRVFVFHRKEADPKHSLYARDTVWQGTHVAKRKGLKGLALLRTALMDRITRSLFLSRVFPTELFGYCWDQGNPESSKHLGILFKIEIDNDHTATDLKKKEFRKGKGRGHDLVGQFTTWPQLKRRQNKILLEPWSKAVLAAFAKK